ncbi:hypothetical protein [Amycolatopsis magusensis]|uniref:hypothetical protein n=1 Tax=Amycolatopsis magusensis TaxID=882444 RepID=UPI00379F161F
MEPGPTSSARQFHVTAWIGAHPVTGADVAHLLLHPQSAAASVDCRAVATALDLASIDGRAMPSVPAGTAHVIVDGRAVHLRIGTELVLSQPYQPPPEWIHAAEEHGFVILSCGTTHFTGGLADLDAYLGRPGNVFVGKVPVAGASPVPSPIVMGGLADLAALMPLTDEDVVRRDLLAEPLRHFFDHQAEPDRGYTMAEIGEVTGIGPEDTVALMSQLNVMVEHGLLRLGPPAGGAGPTWKRSG